jgi:hypothetical protein
MLMTKFVNAEKIELSDLPNQSIQFSQFQSKTKEGAKLQYLNIPSILKQEKGLKGMKGPR